MTSFSAKARTRGEARGPKLDLLVRIYFIDNLSPKKALDFSVPFVRRYLLKKRKCRINDSKYFNLTQLKYTRLFYLKKQVFQGRLKVSWLSCHMSLDCFLINQVQITIPTIPLFLCSCAEKNKDKTVQTPGLLKCFNNWRKCRWSHLHT